VYDDIGNAMSPLHGSLMSGLLPSREHRLGSSTSVFHVVINARLTYRGEAAVDRGSLHHVFIPEKDRDSLQLNKNFSQQV